MSRAAVHSCTLNTGAKMPAVGVGCWFQRPVEAENQETYDMVANALKYGYRHIDTAFGYGNEQAVGKAVRDSGIPRQEIFVTTKLTNSYHGKVQQGFEESFKALNIDYIDLFLVHWPQGEDPETGKTIPKGQSPTFVDTWKNMEKLVGPRCKAIGVSNFSVKNLEILLKEAKVVPAANQVESHIYLPQASLDKYCKDKGIVLTAYSPLGQPASGKSSPILDEPLVKELAKKYDTQPGTILISWVAQRPNWNTVPKSSNPARLKANFEIVKLDQADHDALSAIHKESGKTTSLVDYAEKMKKERVVFGWSVEDMGWENLD
ncbi:Aldo/keto reductase [Kockovaella imperatae]|uniref:Aldo/keto reductase n=1 Tax=Kockovaella imperatae TaxID=4999 RepID=A0A1Y1UCB7_9TREE|nr:Aldo/keto reductase [Kockovaella imperatae]ORX35164.1 Aldo/keto reductase [Kockovaella imperatae]